MGFGKTAYEEFFRYHDFSAWLTSGETITNVTVTARDKTSGSDMTATMVSAAAPYNGTKVTFKVLGGVAGGTYVLDIRIITSNGQKFEAQQECLVV